MNGQPLYYQNYLALYVCIMHNIKPDKAMIKAGIKEGVKGVRRARLNRETREKVIELRRQGWTYREIADALGISEAGANDIARRGQA